MNLSFEYRIPVPVLRHLLTSDDIYTLLAYAQDYGLPTDRLEVAIARSGSAICGSNGSKVKPSELIYQQPAELVPYEVGASHLAAWLGNMKQKKPK